MVLHPFIDASISKRIAVMDAGRLLTVEDTTEFSGDGNGLRHPFARALWRALPQNRFATEGHGAWH